MPKHIRKSLKKCLSKIKKYPLNIRLVIPSSYSFSASKNWILSGCKHHPRTLSFAVDRNQTDNTNDSNNAATLSDIDRFLYENFKSLYINDEEDNGKKEDCDGDEIPKGVLSDSHGFIEPPSNLWWSHPFLVAPGIAGSPIEEANDSFTTNSEDMAGSTSTTNSSPNHHSSTVSADSNHVKPPGDSIAVLRHSQNPYRDFRCSMQEMVEERLRHEPAVDWDFLEKLLFCFLSLNDKKSYKCILRAFVDLVVGLRQS